ncbi:hypothetical protein [Synechococcus sp. H65.1]|uniref:hypothetical protein n=1 Tax=unclassified Synechococcus TaxID=2626047 RepID=UPI0039C0E70E
MPSCGTTLQIPGPAPYWLLNAQVSVSVLKDAVPGTTPKGAATGIPPQGIASVAGVSTPTWTRGTCGRAPPAPAALSLGQFEMEQTYAGGWEKRWEDGYRRCTFGLHCRCVHSLQAVGTPLVCEGS